ncbi:ubiquitin conjugation factor E4 A-like isoform X3 [Anneissia japonica]|nr:ubiquitin conjugation factor E4 A-like isoform X2 [Anneissia japonica]XP_033107324.1 ubiquitin conjugation factor E4 A-like isoform X2 [Anneissia japonica]XP_033107325.1 ubiquitin conjugation factor E4 A-like isoform X3 [Anneissia japonica]
MSEKDTNPFAALMQQEGPSEKEPSLDQELSDMDSETDSGDEEILNLIYESNLINKVFLITINDAPVSPSEGIPTHCVFLFDIAEQIKEVFGQDWTIIELSSAQQAVFERLMCPIPSDLVINTSTTNPDHVSEKAEAGEELALKYLFECYKRLLNLKESGLKEELFNKCESIIASIGATCLLTPAVINNQNVHQQVFDIFMREFKNDNFSASAQFFKLVAEQVNSDGMSCTDAFGPVLTILQEEMKKEPGLINSLNYGYCGIIWFFSNPEYLAEVLLNHMTPADLNSGKAYEESSLGKLLCLTCLYNRNDGGDSYRFFEKPSRYSQQQLSSTQSQIWQLTSLLNAKVHEIFISICKSSVENKHRLLEWLGNCMKANAGRGKIWSLQNQNASDGFFMNIGAVLLHMCHKFATPNSPRMLSIDFRYCKVDVKTSDDMRAKGVHLKELPKSDFLRKLDEGESIAESPDTFNFPTDLFFLTHRCLQLGFNVLHSRFMKVNRELHQYQQAFQEHQQLLNTARATGVLEEIQEKMEKATSVFLSMKAALCETKMTGNCMQFHTATAQLLVQFAVTDDLSKHVAPSLPVREDIPAILACVPAFVVDNLVDFMLFVRRFQEQKFEEIAENLDSVLSFIILFMGNKKRINNYHLRAKLADILDGLRPNFDTRIRSNIVPTYHRQRIFNEHPLRMLLSRSLLSIFNDIEFSGDEHAFEQKFNYRMPMYRILHYLWSLEEQCKWIKDLSEEAMLTIEDPVPPLFVQFINLLINDAIFTLDEAMDYLKKIRELEMKKESAEWEEMPAFERIQHENNLRTQGSIARFFNTMANESIKVLSHISTDIKDVFTHPSMVDRVAAMFNDFLVKLVGRKMGLLKVSNFEEYEFNPKQLVKDISQIYVNLGDRDEFCEAVARDERSYTPGLFIQVERVLLKIFAPSSVIEEIKVVATKVKSMSMMKETEEELFADAPDEFLDPLLSILMSDPVFLPTSNQTVERSTIQRHIMSDPHDPFNRKDLTMDMVVPNDELRKRIEEWKKEKLKNS